VDWARRWTREVAQDTRHALRLWMGRPLLAAFAIAALAIGIGANTGVFSVVNALILRSLPFRDPSRLASLQTWLVPHDSAEQFHHWRRHSAYLSDAALFEQIDFNLGSAEHAVRAHVAQTSWNFFSLLGVQPALGRTFTPGEDTPGRNAIAVIGYGLWQELFAGDARALGSTVRVNGMPLTVVGVMPAGFDFPGHAVLWKAAQFSPGNNGWETVARLQPGISWTQARAAFTAEMDRLAPDRRLNLRFPPKIAPLEDQLIGPVKKASWLLMAAVALILLIACTNVANLLLARTADRAAELSIRSALGASRARLIRQVLTECVLLSSIAASAGLVVAHWTTALTARVQPAPLATQSYSILDSRVLGFTVMAALVSGLFFGVLPSLQAGRMHALTARASIGGRGSRLIRDSLVAAQVMLTIVLLTASVSVGRAFAHLMRIDRGFNVSGLVAVNVSLPGTTRDVAGRQLPYFQEALARIHRLPGVVDASATEFLPLYATGFVGGPFGLDGRPPKQSSMFVPVMADYFRTMRAKVLYGRDFTPADIQSNAKVAIVNEEFARQFGQPEDVLGHQITFGSETPRRIIGIVKGMDYMTEGANTTQIFVPAHSPGGFFSTFVVRVAGDAEELVPLIRDAIRSVDPHVPVFGAKTMEQRLQDALARPKFYSTAIQFFAGFAALLAAIGIYGIVFYAVAQRMQEMGVRMALGTTSVRVRTMLLRQGMLTIAAGAVPGIAAALIGGRFLENLIEGAKPIDAGATAIAVLSIALIAATAIWAGTRRIHGLDIGAILRAE